MRKAVGVVPQNPYASIEHGEPGMIGWRIHYFNEVTSTQHLAAEMAEAGAAQGTVVIAELQTAGRGRLGRSWHSPAGLNLYTTIILRPTRPIGEVALLSLMAGIASAETLATVAPGLAALKWPNDIWLNGRKAGGIISEAIGDAKQRLSCVLIGIGLNLNLGREDVPEELRDKATSVRIATGHRCDRISIAATLFNRLDSRYMEIEAQGFVAIRPEYEKYLALAGKVVTVVEGGSKLSGRVRGIDVDGALILETARGQSRVTAGEVSVEGAYE